MTNSFKLRSARFLCFFFVLFLCFILIISGVDEDDDWCDSSTNVSDTEEYFEDFHLPMTHVNSMSTRRSFRRKVQSVDLHEPDADRIEGIVKSGQLNRHGSIRRKIVPQPCDFANDSFNDVEYKLESIALDISPLDEQTLLKIRDCLDGEKMKDIYTLGSRLQDLLSPAEMKEIINNSHRYSDVIAHDILLVLSETRQHNNYINQSLKSQLNQPDLIDNNENSKVVFFSLSVLSILSGLGNSFFFIQEFRNPLVFL